MKFKTTRTIEHTPDAKANGASIRQLRSEAGIALRALARAMGITAAYLSDMELGKRSFSRQKWEQAQAIILHRTDLAQYPLSREKGRAE